MCWERVVVGDVIIECAPEVCSKPCGLASCFLSKCAKALVLVLGQLDERSFPLQLDHNTFLLRYMYDASVQQIVSVISATKRICTRYVAFSTWLMAMLLHAPMLCVHTQVKTDEAGAMFRVLLSNETQSMQ